MFMRFTVLIFDILIYFSGAYLFVFHSIQINSNKKTLLFAFILTQPALILIDHGHFQYNSISLGLSLWAIIAVLKERPLLGSLLFTLSLNYKQMSLYYAPAFFFYLLGWSFGEPDLKIPSSDSDRKTRAGRCFNICWDMVSTCWR
eukprot:TRINITY_DN4241_c0_g1_i2.p1 TRINITY_DN4241_c0_g1~~TRINITY_DN4241_c0_g1_i2.p1  ORF type:complete len:145 (+),score=8.24 TRINITY_DN4241_c0_g1_i2:359-793(+)